MKKIHKNKKNESGSHFFFFFFLRARGDKHLCAHRREVEEDNKEEMYMQYSKKKDRIKIKIQKQQRQLVDKKM